MVGYYAWQKPESAKTPWDRKSGIEEFYRYERQQIVRCTEWRNKLFKTGDKKPVEEGTFFVIPADFPKWAYGGLNSRPGKTPIHLSALGNCLQVPVIALFDQNKTPEDYRLVRIITAIRDSLIVNNTRDIEPCIIVDTWEYLPQEDLYLDVKPDRGMLRDVLKEGLGDDELVTKFSAPMVGAPVGGTFSRTVGGIALASVWNEASFANRLKEALESITAPELRTSLPPKKFYEGCTVSDLLGIKSVLAERPTGSSRISHIVPERLGTVKNEIDKRAESGMDWSIVSAVPDYAIDRDDLMNNFINFFMKNEVSIPERLSQEKFDINPSKLEKYSGEEVWTQQVLSHRINPLANKEDLETTYRVKWLADLDVMLSGKYRNDALREDIARNLLPAFGSLIHRLAQSLARQEFSKIVTSKHLERARNITMSTWEGFVKNPALKLEQAFETPSTTKPRVAYIISYIENNSGRTSEEIYKDVASSGRYKNFEDFENLLSWLNVRGHIFFNKGWFAIKRK